MFDDKTLHIYTDGSSLSRPRRGGFAVRFVYEDSSSHKDIEIDFEYPGHKGATNNEMELYACTQGLKECLSFGNLSQFDGIVIFTDSLYVADHYKKAMFQWPTTRWMKTDGSPVLNAKLWKDLVKHIKKLSYCKKRVEIKWIKGHAKNKHNKAVDKLAKKSAKSATHTPNQQISVSDVRRKKSHKSVEQGSVKMKGQKISIRIITCKHLAVQRVWRHQYEVISEKSKYYKNVDFIFHKRVLRPGHSYEVSFNKDNAYPMICKVYRDINEKPVT